MKNNEIKTYESNTSEFTTEAKIKHHLFSEPEYLSFSELMFSYGFIKIMSMIWAPFIILIILYKILGKKLNKRR